MIVLRKTQFKFSISRLKFFWKKLQLAKIVHKAILFKILLTNPIIFFDEWT